MQVVRQHRRRWLRAADAGCEALPPTLVRPFGVDSLLFGTGSLSFALIYTNNTLSPVFTRREGAPLRCITTRSKGSVVS